MPDPSSSCLFSIPEILELVLQHVPPLDLLSSCRAVCRTWNDIISTSWTLKYYATTGLDSDQYLLGVPRPELTPAARDILSLFWRRLYTFLNTVELGNPKFLPGLYKLYTSFEYPFQNIITVRPPQGRKRDFNFHKITFRRVLRSRDRDAEERRRSVFEKVFGQNGGYEELQAGTHPLRNIAYALCERAHHLEPERFLSLSHHGDFYAFYGDPTYFKPTAVRFKIKHPRTVETSVGPFRGERQPLDIEKCVQVEFLRGEPFSVSIKHIGTIIVERD
ncbi:hypothetical protein TWF481_010962 [Arthrobotrys musiformis]|uniref:F-box domain-containing protein n=1 Tax=Arthrobotrys musiformis TaxID=47236 RepID=A0AAV9VYS3_9PEZI